MHDFDLLIIYGVGMNISGKAGVQFYTQIKTVTQQWKDLPGGVSLAMPTSQKS